MGVVGNKLREHTKLTAEARGRRFLRRRRTLRDRYAREAREKLEAEGQLTLDLVAARDPLAQVFD